MKGGDKISSLFFFGSMMLPEESQKNPCSSFSANRFQYELLVNLLKVRVSRVVAICPIPLHSYPKIPRFTVTGREVSPQPELRIISPPFINWGAIKILSLVFTVTFSAIRAMIARGRPEALMVYNPYLGYTIPALLLSRLFKIPVIGIVADLRPAGGVRFRTALRQMDANIQQWLTRRFDGMLPFSIHTAHDLGFLKPFLRLDPGISTTEFARFEPMGSDKCERVLLFCGTLNAENGLKLLMDAFAKTKDHTVKLWISGRGQMQAQVEALATENPCVRYLGFLEREELLIVMQRSLILVNPRPPSLPENRYNFPSKILEYLASGRPVISLASGDIAQEYGDYLILLARETPEAFALLIDDICRRSPEELDGLGRIGRDFVLKEKNWTVLAKKVSCFLEMIIRGDEP